jgi:hypothetical protein
MIGTPEELYPSNSHGITLVFDLDNPEEAELLQAFRRAFGEGYSRSEDLVPPRYYSLDLLPGGALGARR